MSSLQTCLTVLTGTFKKMELLPSDETVSACPRVQRQREWLRVWFTLTPLLKVRLTLAYSTELLLEFENVKTI